jgi:hypothetical protein
MTRLDGRDSIPGRGNGFPLTSVSRPALGPTQPPVQWVPGVLSPGVKRDRAVTLTTHDKLVPRLRMNRSYTSPLSRLHSVVGQLYILLYILSRTNSSSGTRCFIFTSIIPKYYKTLICVLVKHIKVVRMLTSCVFSLVFHCVPVLAKSLSHTLFLV